MNFCFINCNWYFQKSLVEKGIGFGIIYMSTSYSLHEQVFISGFDSGDNASDKSICYQAIEISMEKVSS